MSNTELPPGAILLPSKVDADLPPGAALLEEDKYRKAARADLARPQPWGARGYTQRVGMGIPWSDEIMAAAFTPVEMARQGTINPAEGYRYAKARENLAGEQTRENTAGVGGIAAEVAGGLATGAGVLGGGTRLGAATIGNITIPSRAVNYAANVGKAGGLGVATGAGEGDTLAERGKGALIGGGVGTTLGAALPAVAAGIGPAARLLQIPRLRDPEKIATEHVAKVARDAGVSMEELANRMAAARAAGQPDYTVADAIGHAAERKLDAIHKVPGPARERIAEVLTDREANMPGRVVEGVLNKFNAPGTAAQETARLIKRAGDDARPYYRAAEAQQGAIWNDTIAEGIKHPDILKGIAHGVKIQRTRSAMGGEPFNPTDAAIVGFNEAGDPVIKGVPNFRTLQTAKIGLDSMIQAQTDAVTGKLTHYGAALVGLKNRLNEQIAAARPDYATANKLFSDPMRITEAIQVGKDMARRGSPRDTVPAFGRLNEPEKQGVRIGWANDVLEPLERTGNFPTMLRAKSPKGQAELEAMSPYGPATLREFLAREEEMQRLGRGVMGGSQTAGRLADIAQGPGGAEALGIAGNVAGGNFMGALRGGYDVLKRVSQGESEAQRSAITRALLANDPSAVTAMQRRIAEHELRRRGVNPFVSRPPRYRAGE
jgi:hypothetical protein